MRKQRRRLPALARAGMKCNLFFCTDMCRAKNTSHPESASFAGAVRGAFPNFGSPAQRVPKFLPFPARPAGGRAVTGVGQMGRRPGKKRRRTPAGSPQTRKGGSREEEPLPPWCSFLRLSSKESRAPARGRAGNGALRPEAPEKPRPPEGYAVPPRAPARDRAGNHLAGPTLRRSGRDHLPTAEAPAKAPLLTPPRRRPAAAQRSSAHKPPCCSRPRGR